MGTPSHPIEPFGTYVTSDASVPPYADASYAGALPTKRIDRSRLHPVNTLAPSSVTLSGTVSSVSAEQFANARDGSTASPFGNAICERSAHPMNAASPSSDTPAGMPAAVRDQHPLNARAPIAVRLGGISTATNAEQPSKSDGIIW